MVDIEVGESRQEGPIRITKQITDRQHIRSTVVWHDHLFITLFIALIGTS